MSGKIERLDFEGLTHYDGKMKEWVLGNIPSLPFWQGTYKEFDEIETKDNATIYIVYYKISNAIRQISAGEYNVWIDPNYPYVLEYESTSQDVTWSGTYSDTSGKTQFTNFAGKRIGVTTDGNYIMQITFNDPLSVLQCAATYRTRIKKIEKFPILRGEGSFNSSFNGMAGLRSIPWESFNNVVITSAGGMFNGCGTLQSADCSGWHFADGANLQQMFAVCTALSVVKLNAGQPGNVSNLFVRSTLMSSLEINIDMARMTNTTVNTLFGGYNLGGNNVFYRLTDITGNIENIKANMNISHLTALTADSAMLFISGLYDYSSGDAPSSTPTLTLSNDVYAKLEEWQLAEATAKGWSVVASELTT